MSTETDLKKLAEKEGFSFEAVDCLFQALVKGNGTMAQFNHSELGGMGQWMPGSIMIGTMGQDALKAKVERLCNELAPLAKKAESQSDKWWPEDLGAADMVGAQGNLSYAIFKAKKLVLVSEGGKIETYSTAGHTITGVAQQSSEKSIKLSTPNGVLTLADLKRVD